jgi:hypothetical protein
MTVVYERYRLSARYGCSTWWGVSSIIKQIPISGGSSGSKKRSQAYYLAGAAPAVLLLFYDPKSGDFGAPALENHMLVTLFLGLASNATVFYLTTRESGSTVTGLSP